MWHIVLLGYVFTTAMFAFAQHGIIRIMIYLMIFTILPVWFAVWVALVRRRNRLMKLEEQASDQSIKNNH